MSWTSFENLTDSGAGIFNMHSGADGSVTGNITATGGTLNYALYSTAVTFDLGDGAGNTTGIGGSWTGITTVTGSSHNDTITGSGATYNLTGADAGNSGGISWTSFENLDDAGAGIFNMHSGADGSVSGSITASGGTVNYAGYTTAVTFNLSGAASTGITVGWTGITSVTGSGNTDTISGLNQTYNLTGLDQGDNGAVSWTSFENVSDTGVGTIATTGGQTYNLTGLDQGNITGILSGTFTGIGHLTDTGAATFNMGTNGSVTTVSAVGGSVDYTNYGVGVTFNLGGGASTGITGGWTGITSVTGSMPRGHHHGHGQDLQPDGCRRGQQRWHQLDLVREPDRLRRGHL